MITPRRLLTGALCLLLCIVLFRCDSFPRPNSGNSGGPAASFRTAIVKLPFHDYYREIGYVVDDEGRAIYQGDIDLGPENQLRSLSEENRLKFRRGQLPNGQLKLRTGTRFTAIRQQQQQNPQPAVINKSSVILDPEMKWYGGEVPFEIDNNFTDPTNVTMIQDAIDFVENNTSVRFIPRVNHSDYIRFTACPNCRGGGSSAVGKQGGRQKIRLKEGSIGTGGTVHEIMHALGIYHTQSRTDRDDFVCINLNNVASGAEHNFDLHDGEDYAGVYGPYNTNSVMHYSSCAFVDEDLDCSTSPTIMPRNTDGSCSTNNFITANRQLANIPASDIATINYLYGPLAVGLGESVPTNQVRTVTVYINQLTTLVGPEENGLGCNDEMDFYAKVKLGPLADIGADPYQFARSATFNYDKKEGNDIWPGWTANTTIQPGERFVLIHITVYDDDKAGPGGIGACGGDDDVVDVSPFSNMKILHLVLDTESNEVHLSRTTASVPPGQLPNAGNMTFSSTLNGVQALTTQAFPVSGNTSGEDHSARIRVRVDLE